MIKLTKVFAGTGHAVWENFKLTKVFAGSRGSFFKKRPWPPEARLYRVLLIFFLFLFISILPAAGRNIKDMSYEEVEKKYREITGVKKFLETEIPKKYPWSMNEFFDQAIYKKLVGNEFFGYYYDEGVKYSDPGNRIAIDTIGVIKGRGYEKYKDRYTRIFLRTLKQSKKHTYYVEKEARYSVGICIVSIKEKDDAESLKGVVLETYIKDRKTGKHFYHRCGTGSSGELDLAMRLSAVRMICNLEYLKHAARAPIEGASRHLDDLPEQKFLDVQKPFYKKVSGRRRRKSLSNSKELASGGQLFEKSWTKTFINLKEKT